MNIQFVLIWLSLSAGLFAIMIAAIWAATRTGLRGNIAVGTRRYVTRRLADSDSTVSTSLKLFLSGMETAGLPLTAEQSEQLSAFFLAWRSAG